MGRRGEIWTLAGRKGALIGVLKAGKEIGRPVQGDDTADRQIGTNHIKRGQVGMLRGVRRQERELPTG